MRGRKRLISGVLSIVMFFGVAVPTYATNLENQKNELENQIQDAETEKQALANKIKELSNSMKQTEAELEKKQTAIDEAEQKLIMSKLDKNQQYESMKQRIKYMYENGNTNYIQVFLESSSISDFLVKAEYISKLSEYDRDKLNEFQRTIEAIEEEEAILRNEYEELAVLQDSLIANRQETENCRRKRTASVPQH